MGTEDVFGFALGWSVFSSSFISPSERKQHTGGASLCEAMAFIHWQNALLLLLTTCCSVSFFPLLPSCSAPLKAVLPLTLGITILSILQSDGAALRRCSLCPVAPLLIPCRSRQIKRGDLCLKLVVFFLCVILRLLLPKRIVR